MRTADSSAVLVAGTNRSIAFDIVSGWRCKFLAENIGIEFRIPKRTNRRRCGVTFGAQHDLTASSQWKGQRRYPGLRIIARDSYAVELRIGNRHHRNRALQGAPHLCTRTANALLPETPWQAQRFRRRLA